MNKKNELMKDEAFIAKQKGRLLAEKKRLEKELNIDNKFPQYGDNEEANASEVAEFTRRQGLEKQLSGELDDVKVALEKIEDGTYGICQKCNKPIQKDRLEAMPSARFCVKHSSK